MAQVTSKEPGRVVANNVDAVVALGSNSVILEVPVEDIDQLGVEVTPGAQAFDAFIFAGRMSPDGVYQTIRSATWATPSGLVLASSGDLAAQAVNTPGFAVLDVRGLYSVRFSASAAVGAGTATIRVFGKGHKVL